MVSRRSTLLATLTLVAVTAAWGSTFFLIKDLVDRIPPLDFLALRFAIAGVALLVVAPRAVGRLSGSSRRQAMVLGGVYGCGQMLQTAGLAHTSASVAGFITGLYVVATPLFAALLLRTRITGMTWAAVGVATIGLGTLTLQGFSIGYGEGLTLIAALLYALHIVGLGAWSRPGEALGMSIVQVFIISGMCWLAAAPGGVVFPATRQDWWAVIYMALVAGAMGMLGQTWAQARLSPTRTAIVMSTEPVFAALFAVWLGGEFFTLRMAVGGVLVLTAMLVVEIAPGRTPIAEVQHIAG